MTQVFILGSCVTRDAFEFCNTQRYEIVKYLARTSLASTFQNTEEVNSVDLSNISSAFQKRMIVNDIFKKTEEELLSTEFDWLIIDLIDERFDLYQTKKNSLFTLSSELCAQVSLPDDGYIIKSNTDEFFKYWCEGWDYLCNLAKKNNFIHKIVVNKVFWTNNLDGGGHVVSREYESWINRNNDWLNRLYDYMELCGNIKFVTYDPDSLLANGTHQWGKQPYHYYDAFYIDFLNKMNSLKNEKINYVYDINYEPMDISIDLDDINNKMAFKCKKTKGKYININLMIASGKSVSNRELLYTIKYTPDIDQDTLSIMGYSLSSLDGIGYFKYIVTEENSIYDRGLNIPIFDNTEFIELEFKKFYPQGKTVILDATVNLEA